MISLSVYLRGRGAADREGDSSGFVALTLEIIFCITEAACPIEQKINKTRGTRKLNGFPLSFTYAQQR